MLSDLPRLIKCPGDNAYTWNITVKFVCWTSGFALILKLNWKIAFTCTPIIIFQFSTEITQHLPKIEVRHVNINMARLIYPPAFCNFHDVLTLTRMTGLIIFTWVGHRRTHVKEWLLNPTPPPAHQQIFLSRNFPSSTFNACLCLSNLVLKFLPIKLCFLNFTVITYKILTCSCLLFLRQEVFAPFYTLANP